MLTVTEAEVARWLDAYYAAWRAADSTAASMLFTEDAAYVETPFEAPWPEGKRMRGRQQIADYWHWVTVELSRFLDGSYDLWAVKGHRGFARWWADAELREEGYWVQAEGVLKLSFMDRVDGQLRCGELLEWNAAITESEHHYENYVPRSS